jgi:hypothetical protein
MTRRWCKEARGFDADEKKYGLTCGYWSNVAKNVDRHILRHHLGGSPMEEVYDLCDEQYDEDKYLRGVNS